MIPAVVMKRSSGATLHPATATALRDSVAFGKHKHTHSLARSFVHDDQAKPSMDSFQMSIWQKTKQNKKVWKLFGKASFKTSFT